jgi:predicted Zn-dependent protease
MHPLHDEGEMLALGPTDSQGDPSIPRGAEAAYARGVNLHRSGKLDGALMAYGDAIRMYPTYVDALNDIASIYILLNRPESALTFLRRAQRVDASNVPVMVNMATAFVKMQNYDSGIGIFEQILNEHSNSNVIRYLLAKAYWNQGNYDASETIVREVLENAPDMIEGWVLLLDLSVEQGNQSCIRETLLRLETMLDNVGFSKFVEGINKF